ncbi:cation-transporting ATPase 4 [Grosmannia clavigera kw1407]|uniref:Cation-transporting ATPase 4 n=1 Tax=Grosmannia clavigera (strain kw1407 / UAMH 11150) TaxID=655863 RepID=F0XQX7_GROCL|nr:cation-transporting ATPase 4 [Grosmannia clavigera kw1407]EFW99960.1 cation-transporting ATPase 4 [Grosmannia clavigera kw1407]
MGQVGGQGYTSLIVASVMLGLSWLVVSARLAVRHWKKTIGVDDYLMLAGLALYSVTASFVISACFHGSGQHASKLTTADIMTGTKLFYIAEYFYAGCTAPIKWSICVCLIRIAESRRAIVYVIWGVMGMSACATLIFIITIANICHPIQTLWGAAHGTCNARLNSDVSFFFSAVSIVTDWTLATLPAFLLWNIQMKPRVKLSCMLMLGLGAFASTATIVRLRYLTLYNDSAEFMFSTGAIGLWSVLEEGIGIISGSMPALRPLLNLSIFHGSSYNISDNRNLSTNAVGLQTIGGTNGRKEARRRASADDDGDSQKQIFKQTQISISGADGSRTADEDWTKQQVLGWQS